MIKIEIHNIDITTLHVDVIVNAANETLLGGGGVDGAINKAAGPELAGECWRLGGCKTGDVKLTNAYKLPSKYVIHAVGPRYIDGTKNEAALLESCYSKSLQLAVDNATQSIAFPAISCGIYRYPVEKASKIALKTVRQFLENNYSIQRVVFACSTDTYNYFLHENDLM